MTDKNSVIHFRVNANLKNSLEKIINNSIEYDNVSELIRSILIDYILGKLVYKTSSEEKNTTKQTSLSKQLTELTKFVEKLETSQKETQERVMRFISYVENGQRSFPEFKNEPKRNWKIEEEILRLVEIKPMTSEQLAKAFKMTEYKILKFLNPLLKYKTLGLNDKMEYYLIETEEDFKKNK